MKTTRLLLMFASSLTCLSYSFTSIAQGADLESLENRSGYSIGANIGSNLATQGLAEDLDLASLLMGISDAFNGELQMTDAEIVATLQEFTLIQETKAQAAAIAENQAAIDFMAENAVKEGVMTTSSGLQYLVMQAVDGNADKPTAFDSVNVHYHGTLVDGSVFDSSVDRGEPISFSLSGVIPGWTEGLQLMKVGEKFKFFIPGDLAYGQNGIPQAGIGPNTPLIFEVELLGIE